MKKAEKRVSSGLEDIRPVGSLNRATILLREIAQGPLEGSSLKRLVSRTKLPRSTIHRILDNLIEIGWVTRGADSHYFNLDIGLAALGHSAIARNPIEKVANTHLTILAKELGLAVYLSVRSQLDTICIGCYESDHQVQTSKGYVGMRIPFGLSPTSMAMMVHLPKAEVALIIEKNLSGFYKQNGFDEMTYRRALNEAINNHYASYDGLLFDQATSGLGVAILDQSGYPVAGIGSTYIKGSLDDQQKTEAVTKLQQAAKAIANQLLSGRYTHEQCTSE